MLSNVLPNKRRFHLSLLLLMAFLASGCTTTPEPPPVADPTQTWQQRQPELAAIKAWRLSGRVAVSQGDEAWNLNMEWQQNGDNYEIQLHGPFGAGRVRLIGNANGVILQDSDDQSFYADHPEILLYERTGVHMPVDGLRYWIVGLTSPTQTSQPRLDTQGRLAYLEDTDWKVKFKRYVSVSGIQLPGKVFIVKPEQEIDVRLVVDEWKLGAY